MSQELIDSVNALTTQTNSLLNEYTDAKSTIDSKVANVTVRESNAATSATNAATSETNASTSETNAAGSAAAAAASAATAAEVSGLNTVTVAVDLALADSFQFMRTEADMEAMRAQNNERFAASGFVHFGKSLDGGSELAINEGLSTALTVSNLLFMGRRESDGVGGSKTPQPHVNIAGFVTEVCDLNYFGIAERNHIKFPEAPNGTVTYDSADGSIVNYETDVDPKYGDVAATQNEAVARAFEGKAKNSGFRLGDTGVTFGSAWTHNATDKTCEADSATAVNSALTLPHTAFTIGETYTIKVEVSGTGNGVHRLQSYGLIGDVYVDFNLNSTPGEKKIITITGEADGTNTAVNVWFDINSTTDTTLTVHSHTVFKDGVEVVTERHDMYGLEGFLRHIDTGTFVYPNGLIQSQATTMNGISTADEAARPDSFFAVYLGDTGSRGKGLDFHALSAANQAKVMADPKNHIYRMENGNIVQWCIRQRTIAGAGNGDWLYTDASQAADLRATSACYIQAQGVRDALVGGVAAAPYEGFGTNRMYRTQTYADGNISPNAAEALPGLFWAGISAGTDTGYNDLCCFMVLGTVSRLNQGAFHPRFNKFGTGLWRNDANNDSVLWTGLHYSTFQDQGLSNTPVTPHDCFNTIRPGGNSAWPYCDLNTIKGSGRPDGRFYDAICADGLGGVIDYRPKYGAWDASSKEQASEVKAEVISGEYRGKEKLQFTQIVTGTLGTTVQYVDADTLRIQTDVLVDLSGSDRTKVKGVYVECTDGEYYGGSYYTLHADARFIDVKAYGRTSVPSSPKVVIALEIDHTVSGEFTQTDVIGDPANIIQCDALKDGWLGNWIPVIPEGTSKTFPLTRKQIGLADNTLPQVVTDDNGATWATGQAPLTGVTNDATASYAATRVGIWTYTANAKQTKGSTNLPVLHGEAGYGSVHASFRDLDIFGCHLMESILGKIPISSWVTTHTGNYVLTDTYNMTHSPITLDAPLSNSPAMKVLDYQIEVDGQASLGFHANELIHATDWGDDGTMEISSSGVDTFLDDNGNTCIKTVHELAMPIGWIKVDK